MILGIGNDIIEIERIKENIQRYQQRFLDRVFTSHEQGYCQKRKVPALHFAGRFAAKEAIVKALGTGFSNGLTWLDIEINNDALGKPFVQLSPKAEKLFDSPTLLISISHCREYATAFAIWSQIK
jgi:holo-[acyl-carrier protein] synthase